MRMATLKSSIVMSFFLLIAAYTAAGKVIYVDSDAQGPVYDGSSWTTAFEYLQEALTGATNGDEIRVAQGIYKPHEPVFLPPPEPPVPPPPPDRTATFQLKNGVVIRGGYAGFGEPAPDARDVELYETILTGDLYGNDIDVNDPYALFDEPTRTENSYHVVTASQVDQTSILDGFTIAAGNANNVDLYSPHSLGGGMYNYESSSTVIDCTFERNAAGAGGGMYNMSSGPTLRNCSFIGNSAHTVLHYGGSGGGIYTRSYSGTGHPEVVNCVFEGNSAASGGGISSGGQLVVTDCIFNKNRGGGIRGTATELKGCAFTSNEGGGIFIGSDSHLSNCLFTGNIGGGLQAQDCDIVVTNCSFIGNITSAFFAGIWNDEGDTTVTNCISWGNIGKDGVTESAQIATHDPAVINYCCIQGWSGALGGTGNTDADPCFVSEGYWDTLPDFNEDYWYRHINWSDGDYHLLPDSACIDSGDNLAVPSTVTTDLDGNPRIRGQAVDMGVYESPAVYFVDIDATGANDGSSWADAYNYLQDALMMVPAGDEIRVAEGTYKPDQFVLSDRPNLGRIETFQLTNGVAIKGGYAGFGEPAPDARDIELYETILSGDLLGNDIDVNDAWDVWREPSFVDNSYHVVTGSGTNSTAVLDGFTVTSGCANDAVPDGSDNDDILLTSGAGMLNDAGSPTVLNCTFRKNRTWTWYGQIDGENSFDDGSLSLESTYMFLPVTSGASVFNRDGSPTFQNCIFEDNVCFGADASSAGAGVCNINSSPVLVNCVFRANVVTGFDSGCYGGAMANYNSNPRLKNCSFLGNRTDYSSGGAIHNEESNLTLENCTFRNNKSKSSGGAIFLSGGNSNLTDCIFDENVANSGGGGMCVGGGLATLTNCTFRMNTAAEGGGIKSNFRNSLTLKKCIFIGNSAGYTGGAIENSGAWFNDPNSVTLIADCLFTANSANRGGGVYNDWNRKNLTVVNCIFSGNEAAKAGGGIYNYGCEQILSNCTFAGNSALEGDALACDLYWQETPSNLQITNCIFRNGENGIRNDGNSVVTITYSDVQGGWAGDGNIDAEPLFIEPGYWDTNEVWVEGDYRLGAASPCIDAGTDGGVYDDIDGTIRPFDFPGVDNNSELPDFDMGAYEAVAMIQGKLIMQPNTVNRNAQGPKIFAFIRLPEPIVEEDIDLSEPLVLYPGGIEADEQKLLPDKAADDSVRIRAVFDRAELLAVTPDNGDVEVTVVGRFISGLYFYGTGTVTIK